MDPKRLDLEVCFLHGANRPVYTIKRVGAAAAAARLSGRWQSPEVVFQCVMATLHNNSCQCMGNGGVAYAARRRVYEWQRMPRPSIIDLATL